MLRLVRTCCELRTPPSLLRTRGATWVDGWPKSNIRSIGVDFSDLMTEGRRHNNHSILSLSLYCPPPIIEYIHPLCLSQSEPVFPVLGSRLSLPLDRALRRAKFASAYVSVMVLCQQILLGSRRSLQPTRRLNANLVFVSKAFDCSTEQILHRLAYYCSYRH